jgi:hypothetical protein
MDLMAFCLYKYSWVTIRELRVCMYLARFLVMAITKMS